MRYNILIDDEAVKRYVEKSKLGHLDVVIQQAIAASTMIPSNHIKVVQMTRSVERRINAIS